MIQSRLNKLALTLLLLTFSVQCLMARPLQNTTRALDEEQILNGIPAQVLEDAAMAVESRTGLAVSVPVRAFKKGNHELWLEYPEVWPDSGEPIYYNLNSGAVGNAELTGIVFDSSLAVTVSRVLGTYSGPVKMDIEGSKSFIKIKGNALLNCKLIVVELKKVPGTSNYTLKGSLTYSGKIKVKGQEKKFSEKKVTFNHSSKPKITLSNGEFKYEFDVSASDYKVNIKGSLNGVTTSGKAKVSGKSSGIKVEGDGRFAWDKAVVPAP